MTVKQELTILPICPDAASYSQLLSQFTSVGRGQKPWFVVKEVLFRQINECEKAGLPFVYREFYLLFLSTEQYKRF